MARVENISYWRGKSTSMPTDAISGRILAQDDTGNVFLDFADYATGKLSRVQLTDTRKFDKEGETLMVLGDKQKGIAILKADAFYHIAEDQIK